MIWRHRRQDASCIARIDDAVIPQTRRAEQHVGLAVQALAQLVAHGLERILVDGLAGPLQLGAPRRCP